MKYSSFYLIFLLCFITSLQGANISYHPITDDADSGISSDNIYTHAIDFGLDTPSANINGVQFQSTFNIITGSSAVIGTGSTTTPSSHTGNDNADPFLNGGSFANMEDLMEDFVYGDATALIQLTGLTSGSNYQLRLYNRVYGASAGNRHQQIGFDIDGVGSSIADAEDTAEFLEDDARALDPGLATYSQVYALTYNYALADNVTTLSIYIDRQDVGTYHLYGLTNAKTSGPLGLGKLTPSDNTTYHQSFSDNLILGFDDDVLVGSGNIVIYNSDNSIFESIDVTSSQINIINNEVYIDPSQNLTINSEYYIHVDSGTFHNNDGSYFSGFSDNTTWNFSTYNDIYYHPISGDEDSGIDSKEIYTHAIDFGGGNVAVINDVVFQSGFGDPSGTSATIGTGTTNQTNNANNNNADPYLNGTSSDNIKDLMYDLKYNADNTEIILTGLTPGKNYQIRLFHRVWGSSPTTRSQDIGFETDGVGTTLAEAELISSFYEDDARQAETFFENWYQVYALTYNYTLSPGVTQLKIYINKTSTGTYHLYGLVNQERRVPGTIIKFD